jgi:hypothetical protein
MGRIWNILTLGRSRLADLVTLTTVISKVPVYDGEQPAGAGADGGIIAVTPCGIGFAMAAAASASKANV